MSRMKQYISLMWDFIQFGLFTFGGGWSIVSQMQQKYVDKEKTMTPEELLDITSVARSLPGTMIGNVAMLYGYRTAGFMGGIFASLALCLPPMVLLVAISYGYDAFRTNYWVNAGMEGVQAAVVPIILSAAIGMIRGSVKNWFGVAVLAVSAAAFLALRVSVVYLILFGVASGLIYGAVQVRKEEKHGTA